MQSSRTTCCSKGLAREWKAVSLHACTGESLSMHVLGLGCMHSCCDRTIKVLWECAPHWLHAHQTRLRTAGICCGSYLFYVHLQGQQHVLLVVWWVLCHSFIAACCALLNSS
jgi:hypothetical protein